MIVVPSSAPPLLKAARLTLPVSMPTLSKLTGQRPARLAQSASVFGTLVRDRIRRMTRTTEPGHVEMAIHCKHCGKKQLVHVREGTASSPSPAWVRCVNCGKEFRPDTMVGEILRGPFRPQ